MPRGTAQVLFLPGGALADADDAALARALKERDPRATRVAWQRFSPLVRGIARRTLGPDHDVEDVVQEIFLCLHERVVTLRDPGALRAFVIAIAVRTLRYELRRLWVRRIVRLKRDPEAPDPRVVHPDPEAREAVRRLYSLLDRMRSQDRTAFVLRFIEGFALEEVATALGVSLATAKRRLGRSWDRVIRGVQRDPLLAGYAAASVQLGKSPGRSP